MAALIMVMGKDRAPHDRKVRIGAQKIMRKHPDEIQQVFKRLAGNLHRDMFLVQHNAVFIIVCVGRILQEPISLQ